VASDGKGQRRTGLVLATALASVVYATAGAQPYPSRPIRVVVPFAPGGAVDLVARTLAPRLNEALGQPVVVDNRGGAGGTVGTDIVAKARPDGHTLLVASMGVAVNAVLYPKLPYDTLKDIAPVTTLGEQPNIVVVHPSVSAKSVGELVALARSKPGQVSYASGGVGSNTHLVTLLFLHMARVEMLHVPYKGLGPAIADLVGGQVQLAISNVSTAAPHVKSGRLRLLAVTSAKRFPLFPDTPTVDEAGVKGYESSGWYGLWVTAGTPRSAIVRLNQETTTILNSAAVRDPFDSQGLQAIPTSPEAFGKRLREEIKMWGPVVKASGAKPE